MNRGRIGEVISGHVDGLNRCDRPMCGRANPFFEFRQFRCQRRLIPDARREVAHQARDFCSRLDEPEDVVDQQEDVQLFDISKVLRHRQGGMSHLEACPWGFVHLSEDHHRLIEHTGLTHFAIQLFRFPAAFTNAAEQADSFVLADDIMDQFGNEHGLADTRPAE